MLQITFDEGVDDLLSLSACLTGVTLKLIAQRGADAQDEAIIRGCLTEMFGQGMAQRAEDHWDAVQQRPIPVKEEGADQCFWRKVIRPRVRS